MKKLLVISVLMNVALAVGLSWKVLTAHAAGGVGGGVPVGNGDVNGDGTIDISDGVYILSFLFTGGPAPKAIECPKGLPATGLMTCYDRSGVEIPCDDATCPGQDGFYHAGCPSEGRFVDNGDSTVTDNCTGLMWQKGKGNRVEPWCGALAYCENLSFAGHDDWRLPNVRELQSIVDPFRSNPSIDPVFDIVIDNEPSVYFWSSTPAGAGYVWYAGFDTGWIATINNNRHGDNPIYVRAVRNAQ